MLRELNLLDAALQRCICYSGHIAKGSNGSVYSAPDLVDSHRNISIMLLVVLPALVVLFIVLDALGRLRRGSYERYVLRWVKRKGAPGDKADNASVMTYSHVCKYCLARCLCLLATCIASKPMSKEQKTWLLPWRLQRQGMAKTSQPAVQFVVSSPDTAKILLKGTSLTARGIFMRLLSSMHSILADK